MTSVSTAKTDKGDTVSMYRIDPKEIKAELLANNLYDNQRDLTKQRRLRISIMSLLLASLLLTIVYGTLENPFEFTLSNIGNFFDYRLFFIVWSIISGLAIQFSMLALFNLEHYHRKPLYWFAGIGTIFLVATALIPALKDTYPFWHLLHTATSVVYALFIFLSVNPFTIWVTKNNPRLRLVLRIWLGVIWGGGLLMLILFGRSGMFELWFFVTLIIMLLYLSLILFEEKIVKLSVAFLKDESNLDLAIEKIYIDLERKARQTERRNSRRDARNAQPRT